MAKLEGSERFKPCKVCGVIVERKRGRQFCGGCTKRRNRERIDIKRLARGVRFIGMPLVCKRCGVEVISTGRKQLYCTPCSEASRRDTFKRYNERHREQRLDAYKKHNDKRKVTEEYREWERRYRREVSSPEQVKRRREDPMLRLNHRMSQLVRVGLLNGKGGRTWRSLVDYSIEELMRHLERQFLPGMSWKNMGDWHIDHITPRASFSFAVPDDPDFSACWALTNLRPLWSKANNSKGSKRLFLL